MIIQKNLIKNKWKQNIVYENRNFERKINSALNLKFEGIKDNIVKDTEKYNENEKVIK